MLIRGAAVTIALGLWAGLANPPSGFGQTKDHRLEDAQRDVALLKRIVEEQGRRIAVLEKQVKTLEAATGTPVPAPVADPVKVRSKAIPPVPWQDPANWSRIKTGMSRVQVEEVLGPPTSDDSVLDSVTLTYKGDAPGKGELSATVKLTDDRVAQVTPPAF